MASDYQRVHNESDDEWEEEPQLFGRRQSSGTTVSVRIQKIFNLHRSNKPPI